MSSNRDLPLFLQYAVLMNRIREARERFMQPPLRMNPNRAAQGPGADTEAGQGMQSENGIAERNIERGLKIAIPVTLVAPAGIITVVAEFISNKSTDTAHELFLKASIISLVASFLSGFCTLLLAIFRAHLPCSLSAVSAVVTTLLVAALGLLALAVGFGVTFYFRRDE